MTLLEDFSAVVVTTERNGRGGPELLPERLARATASVLPVDGASISMVFAADRRLPLGASGEFATTAERLQFTVGEGPCLHAQATGEIVVADEHELALRWPGFHDALVAHTPIRSVISLPLQRGLTGVGALDLFFMPPNDLHALPLADGLTVSREVTSALLAPSGPADRGDGGPAWLDAPSTERRARVWQAIGFLNVGLRLDSSDALAVLRSYAYGDDRSVDEVADDLLAGRLTLDTFSLEGRTSP